MTSMSIDSGLMCFAGPEATGGSETAGTLLLRISLDPGVQAGLFPWDVVTFPGSAERLIEEDAEWSGREDAGCSAGGGGALNPSRDARLIAPSVLVVASMHCGKSLRPSCQDRDCRLVVAKIECSLSENNETVMNLAWQRSRSLPGYCGHANMMCNDLV